MTSHNSTATRVVSRLMRFTKRSGPVTSVQPRRKFIRKLTKIASISLLCAGFANVALASTVNNKSLPHESMAIQANLQIGVAAKATPTPSIAGNSGVLDFADYIQDRKTKGWSSAVYSKYEKEQVIGKLIIDLSGTIVESGKDTHGFYLALAVKAGDPKIDAYAYIPESDILNFSANQKVRLSGLIFDTWVQNLMIKDVVFSSGGKAPAKTATVTAANATAVPTKASVSGSGTKAKNNSTANANANLRSGPGTNYGVVGAVKKGDALTITGSDATNKWFQLSDGNWVSASLVSNPPGNLSVVSAPPAPVAAATKAPVAGVVVVPTATTPAVLAAAPTAAPTAVPTVPQPTTVPGPAPAEFSGAGDSIVNITKPGGANQKAIAIITHQGSSNFSVWSLDKAMEHNDLLVNEIGNYSGTVLFDHMFGKASTAMEISADGPWTIRIASIKQATLWDGSAPIQGTGDNVLYYVGKSGAATITNSGDSNFSVWGFGARTDLLVNEIGSYTGTVRWMGGPSVYEISSSGNWTITIN